MPGSERLRDSAPLAALLQQQKESGRLYAAICAAPAVVFEAQGLLGGPATSHPAFSDQLTDQRYVRTHLRMPRTPHLRQTHQLHSRVLLQTAQCWPCFTTRAAGGTGSADATHCCGPGGPRAHTHPRQHGRPSTYALCCSACCGACWGARSQNPRMRTMCPHRTSAATASAVGSAFQAVAVVCSAPLGASHAWRPHVLHSTDAAGCCSLQCRCCYGVPCTAGLQGGTHDSWSRIASSGRHRQRCRGAGAAESAVCCAAAWETVWSSTAPA